MMVMMMVMMGRVIAVTRCWLQVTLSVRGAVVRW